MNAEQLRSWLLEQADLISSFADYEITFAPDHVLLMKLGLHSLSEEGWNDPGYRFVSLGQDGTGGEVAVWRAPQRPDNEPVVFLGSEGGAGVIAESPLRFAQALAYGPLLQEYDKDDLDAPSRLSREDNWFLRGDDPDEVAKASEALAQYRRSAEQRLGPMPPFEKLVTVSPKLQSEFREWVTFVRSRATHEDAEEQRLAADRRRQHLRGKGVATPQ